MNKIKLNKFAELLTETFTRSDSDSFYYIDKNECGYCLKKKDCAGDLLYVSSRMGKKALYNWMQGFYQGMLKLSKRG